MPIHLPSRRQFLGIAAAGVCTFSLRADATRPQRFALLSDTHINADATTVDRDVNMDAHLGEAVKAILAGPKPDAVLVNGDCAHIAGRPSDYVQFRERMGPVVAAPLPLHCTLGNHDDREPFRQAFTRPDTPLMMSKHVSVLRGTHVDWVLLDSLETPNVSHGVLGDEQRAWLAKALDAGGDKPAVVMVHHNPTPVLPNRVNNGLRDTAALLEVLQPRPRVKALVFGHTHTWKVDQLHKLHYINLPPVGYVFDKTHPSGWLDTEITANGMTLTLRGVGPAHAKHGQTERLEWLR